MRLDPGELYDVADAFGVDLDQVRRDHVISHVLASIAHRERDRFVFYGGTALSRTWTPDARLSEDVDLLVRGSRAEAGRALAAARWRRTSARTWRRCRGRGRRVRRATPRRCSCRWGTT
ncbi:nucleotidyl transferase AbiEii/AbiGii toxin family protein [Cellulomonas fimi]|uniref:nucleotidyl transferase AbiEii/AbiGii toxin family protein n=1 Tax=Cellulomonas fimi TaxID=1708 RepID=UPI002358DAE1|nr:nucleotidyl transferase AbiEii/AbiGii toxin family protein [Cellulomonas fimi]